MTVRRLALFVSLVALVVAAPVLAGTKPSKKRHFALEYIPTSTTGVTLPTASGVSVRVGDFEDKRENPAQLGINREKKAGLPVTTESSVSDFVELALARELKTAGVSVVKEGGTHVIQGEILQLGVDLDGTYQGKASLRVVLEDASGKELHSTVVRGEIARFSMLEGSESYLQTLSDALIEAAEALMLDEGFRTALGGK